VADSVTVEACVNSLGDADNGIDMIFTRCGAPELRGCLEDQFHKLLLPFRRLLVTRVRGVIQGKARFDIQVMY